MLWALINNLEIQNRIDTSRMLWHDIDLGSSFSLGLCLLLYHQWYRKLCCQNTYFSLSSTSVFLGGMLTSLLRLPQRCFLSFSLDSPWRGSHFSPTLATFCSHLSCAMAFKHLNSSGEYTIVTFLFMGDLFYFHLCLVPNIFRKNSR